MGEKGEGLIGTNWLLQNSHGGVKYSIENTVCNIITTTYGVRWVNIHQDDYLVSYVMYNQCSVHLKLI